MDKKPLHSFEIAGAKGGLKSIFSGKPMLGLHEDGLSWSEGSGRKFVAFSQITQLKVSKYYSILTIVHGGETKKITLLNIGMFQTIWTDFARRNNISLVLKAE